MALLNGTIQALNVTLTDSKVNDSYTNETGSGQSPHLRLTSDRVLSIIVYAVIFVVAGLGNLTVLIAILKRRRMSRLNRLILHLATADLLTAFIMIPTEVAWTITITWNAGDAMCRIMSFWKTFGLYLSSFILVAISLDRYFAVVHPLSVSVAGTRGKAMIISSWIGSAICSLPQSFIFHEESHPKFPWYKQCVTFGSFPSDEHELAYNLFNMASMYLLPLAAIIFSYTLIVKEIAKKSKEGKVSSAHYDGLRRSGEGNIARAKKKTLKMTLIIVLVFFLCWTPYYIMAMWYWFDRKSAKNVDPRIQKGLFLFALSNACMDPIVYGLFTVNLKRDAAKWCLRWLPGSCKTIDDKVVSGANSSQTENVYFNETDSSLRSHITGRRSRTSVL